MLVLLLAACASHVQSLAGTAEKNRDDFMWALRWKRFAMAAELMLPEHRQPFITTFTDLGDIHIVDVRLITLQSFNEDRRFEATLEMDYYLLPSVTVKTFRFAQTWVYFEGEDPTKQGYLISTPFPGFP